MSEVLLSGRLRFLSLGDLFQLLGGNNSTGVLNIRSTYAPNSGVIYFEKGNPINASNGPIQGMEAIYSLFGWCDGSFEFLDQPIKVAHVIKKGRMEIILDALRMLDDGEIEKLGPPSFEEPSLIRTGMDKVGEIEGIKVIKGPFVNYAHILEEEDYADGESIVKQGGHGKWIWVILEGVVNICKETSSGLLTVARIGEGCFVGTITALSIREYARSASATTAEGHVRLGLLDTEYLSREYSSLSPDFKMLLLSLDARLRQVTDLVVALSIKGPLNEKLMKGKKVILKKGAPEKKAYKINAGELCVLGESKKGPLTLLSLQQGDIFGNLPFLDLGHEPGSASVMASEDSSVDELNALFLQEEYERLSEVFRNLVFNISTYIFMTTRMAYHLHEKR
ncbi:MAG: cyclic nucleotide-binding domain-containing protein [Deltaproteobacteria bacterium]|nr:cyclic nucleotide-binding domain-containing protein [Deltaproteobacteria bacterium]